MSLIVALVPLAFAAAAAIQAANRQDDQGRIVADVSTRMKDPVLLAGALSDVGAKVETDAESITAMWSDSSAVFSRDANGIWQASFNGTEAERALEIVHAVDAAYGRRVQAAVLDRVRTNAEGVGMRLTRETVNADDSVSLTLQLNRGA